MAFATIESTRQGRVGLIRLNRPQALNALCAMSMRSITSR